ncbi:hypothetical protein F0L68_40105 [Solihabitans fulvus]|uniref:Uncharacterized protein n=1 Tax=Solihabitans fulvus TaxID=1892852 RepID=A0A5B2WBB6_9PSEU|nr:hypothetical protein [Solihabitans fulvus]KAA2247667.1 hypothetical protein F0L68_40105 [Solihabitans fulvus]
MNPEQLIDQMVAKLADAAPAGWARIDVKVWASVVAFQFEIMVRLADGSMPAVSAPAGLTDLAAELRAEMYEEDEDRGAWFSATLALTAPDEREISFNFDEDPQWWPSLPPTVFALDVEEFPRSDENTPDWLREKLVEAVAYREEGGAQ